MEFEFVVVGSGFAGTTIAERIASCRNKPVLVIEKRNHVGGNAYDETDVNGLLVHKYGPHIFHTRSKMVWDYLSQFTEWVEYHHKVLGVIDGNLVPIPFNLNSIDGLFPSSLAGSLSTKLVNRYGYGAKVPILKLMDETDEELKILATYVYEKVFLNYTIKQWGVKPEEIAPMVTARVPVNVSRDNRYFQDKYQGLPKHGYTRMFNTMLDSPNIHVLLNTDFRDIVNVNFESGEVTLFGNPFLGKLIYTGPIDYFFDFKFGALPYRSLKFEFEHHYKEHFQATGTINYPNDYDFTRITEFKHMTHQIHQNTTIVREYPEAYEAGINIPYYPIGEDKNHAVYRRYLQEVKRYENLLFVGRLAEYQYYDMDAVVSKALKVFDARIS